MQNCSVAPTGLPVISPAGQMAKPHQWFHEFFASKFSTSAFPVRLHALFIFKICQNVAGIIMNQSISRIFCILNFIFGYDGF